MTKERFNEISEMMTFLGKEDNLEIRKKFKKTLTSEMRKELEEYAIILEYTLSNLSPREEYKK
jgi:hypothetical protein